MLIFQGFAWFGSMLNNSPNPVLFTIGQLVYPWQHASGLYQRIGLHEAPAAPARPQPPAPVLSGAHR